MARKQEKQTKAGGPFQRAAHAVKKLFTRGGDTSEVPPMSAESARPETSRAAESPSTPRVTRRVADIPLDVLDRAYTPALTSSKAGFRSDGADHEQDQDFALGVAGERWNDEDRLTNKSGDPRIGTHRRTYEPAEARDESRES